MCRSTQKLTSCVVLPRDFLNRTSQAWLAVSHRKAPRDGPRRNPNSRNGGAMYSRGIRRYASWAVAAAFTYTSLWIMTVNPRIAMVQECRMVFGSADPPLKRSFRCSRSPAPAQVGRDKRSHE